MFVGLPCLEGARYKHLTNCSRLLSPTSPFSHAHTRTHHQPDSSPPGLAQWACFKKASAYGSRVGWTLPEGTTTRLWIHKRQKHHVTSVADVNAKHVEACNTVYCECCFL